MHETFSQANLNHCRFDQHSQFGVHFSMSSVKRSSLTSSEHGQMKVSDKWETSTKTTLPANGPDTACDTMSSSSSSAAKTQQQSRDAQKSGNSTQPVQKVNEKNMNSMKKNYEICSMRYWQEAMKLHRKHQKWLSESKYTTKKKFI